MHRIVFGMIALFVAGWVNGVLLMPVFFRMAETAEPASVGGGAVDLYGLLLVGTLVGTFGVVYWALMHGFRRWG